MRCLNCKEPAKQVEINGKEYYNYFYMYKYKKQEECFMTAFLLSFAEYLIKLAVMAAAAGAGLLIGKKLRENKNAKEASYRPQINQRRR